MGRDYELAQTFLACLCSFFLHVPLSPLFSFFIAMIDITFFVFVGWIYLSLDVGFAFACLREKGRGICIPIGRRGIRREMVDENKVLTQASLSCLDCYFLPVVLLHLGAVVVVHATTSILSLEVFLISCLVRHCRSCQPLCVRAFATSILSFSACLCGIALPTVIRHVDD